MRRVPVFAAVFLLTVVLNSAATAQVDEVSEVVGLPIPIGQPVIYGQVMIRNLPRGEKRPIIYVYLRNGGAQLDKYQANENGYWYFLKRPIDGHAITYEVDGNEVGRSIIAGGISGRFRQDVEFDWNALHGATLQKARSSTVSAKDRYDRPAETSAAFEAAVASIKDNRSDDAVRMFNEIVQKDPKDHVAWMLIGTVYYGNKKMSEARRAYSKAIELKPDYFLAYLNFGKLEMSEKAYDKAVGALTRAVEIDANSADANHLLGESLLQMKKGSLAVGFLNRAIALDPVGKADLHLRLASLYNAAGYKGLASAEYKQFLSKVKDYPDRKTLEQYIKENPPKH